jgi:hypothetical protein
MKEILLTKGKIALVDDDMFDYLNQWKWYAKNSGENWYAKRSVWANGKKHNISMHRLLMNISDPKIQIDHKDGDGLNNQKSNLRFCTRSQNYMNKKSQVHKTSIYKGIYYHKASKKYIAKVGYNKNQIYLGYFKNELDAAKAYDIKALELFGEFARPNFPK